MSIIVLSMIVKTVKTPFNPKKIWNIFGVFQVFKNCTFQTFKLLDNLFQRPIYSMNYNNARLVTDYMSTRFTLVCYNVTNMGTIQYNTIYTGWGCTFFFSFFFSINLFGLFFGCDFILFLFLFFLPFVIQK